MKELNDTISKSFAEHIILCYPYDEVPHWLYNNARVNKTG